ncbi:hypothetical protein F5Y09DRAFT_353045 [Xylaria sp. FL1042]|nr:hypothetical protein F5Y09DRAFT_353045 [Xylaria sp. FL1042]
MFKKLISIRSLADSKAIEVIFEDGESVTFDAVIGADGIWSTVRDYVLGDTAADHAPTNAGWWDCRNLVPYEKARAILGDELFKVNRAYGWSGDGGFMMHAALENRTLVMCVASALEKDSPSETKRRPLTRQILTDAFSTGANGPIARGVIQLILDQPTAQLQRYALYEHSSTPTYANGPVCIISDAAHAATPWQAAGGGQAFEDAMILGALLDCVSSAEQVPTAFRKILQSSRDSGMILCAADQTVGFDVESMRTELAVREALIEDFDLVAYTGKAIQTLMKML